MVSQRKFNELKISTNSRLHFGFLNLDSQKPYSYGSMGLTINKHKTLIQISKSKKFHSNLSKIYANKIKDFIKIMKLDSNVNINCSVKPDSHIGLGSGTQLAMALEEGVSKFYKFGTVKNIFSRKFRSGVGYNAYLKGGFIIDCPKNNSKSNELIFNRNFPKKWKIILLFDRNIKGLSGKKESNFFSLKQSNSNREKLSDIVLNEIIPSLIYEDFDIFANGLTRFQKLNSLFYSSIQKSYFLSNDIGKVIKKISRKFNVASGQSSWGPTSYIIVNPKTNLNEILSILDNTISMYNSLSYDVVSAANNGRRISYK